ncbi:hypothetical protein BaRGS_00035891, partial [Batillaria attramentaria]
MFPQLNGQTVQLMLERPTEFRFEQNGGLILRSASLAHSGNYSLIVIVKSPTGNVETKKYERSANLTVAEPPRMSDPLQVAQDRKAIYDHHAGRWHVTLTCGQFVSLGHPAVDVVWQVTFTTIKDLKAENTDLKAENTDMKAAVKDIKTENTDIKAAVKDIKTLVNNNTATLGVQGLTWNDNVGADLRTCVGKQFQFEWSYTLDNTEIELSKNWTAMLNGQTVWLMLERPTEFQFEQNGSLTLRSASLAHSGNYSVTVDVMVNTTTGNMERMKYERSANLTVAEPPRTNGRLQVAQDRKAIYDNHTSMWHVTLSCGQFVSLGHPAVDAVWQ